MRTSLRFALVTLLSLPAAAQLPVSLTGRVERVPAGACDAAATHRVACSEILLRSTTIDLVPFEGRTVDITGTTEGTVLCPLVNVSEAVTAPQATNTFALGGYRLNANVIFTTTAPAGSVVAYFFASEPGFLPVLNLGTLQLNPAAQFLYWGIDVSIGVALRTVRIPNEPGLVGQRALFQTAFVSVTPALQLKLLNAGCFTIL